jgi:hypothetical protein
VSVWHLRTRPALAGRFAFKSRRLKDIARELRNWPPGYVEQGAQSAENSVNLRSLGDQAFVTGRVP